MAGESRRRGGGNFWAGELNSGIVEMGEHFSCLRGFHKGSKMTKVTIDAPTAALLAKLDGEVQLCDAEGNLLGWYAPARQPTMQEVIDSCPLSEEEAFQVLEEQRKNARSWADIKKDLEAL